MNRILTIIRKIDPIFLGPLFVIWGFIDNIRTLFQEISQHHSGSTDSTHYLVVAIGAQFTTLVFFAIQYGEHRMGRLYKQMSEVNMKNNRDLNQRRMEDTQKMLELLKKIQDLEKQLGLGIENEKNKSFIEASLKEYLDSTLTKK